MSAQRLAILQRHFDLRGVADRQQLSSGSTSSYCSLLVYKRVSHLLPPIQKYIVGHGELGENEFLSLCVRIPEASCLGHQHSYSHEIG